VFFRTVIDFLCIQDESGETGWSEKEVFDWTSGNFKAHRAGQLRTEFSVLEYRWRCGNYSAFFLACRHFVFTWSPCQSRDLQFFFNQRCVSIFEWMAWYFLVTNLHGLCVCFSGKNVTLNLSKVSSLMLKAQLLTLTWLVLIQLWGPLAAKRWTRSLDFMVFLETLECLLQFYF